MPDTEPAADTVRAPDTESAADTVPERYTERVLHTAQEQVRRRGHSVQAELLPQELQPERPQLPEQVRPPEQV